MDVASGRVAVKMKNKRPRLGDVKWLYCIGIGGIGISAYARLMAASGVYVTGSDLSAATSAHVRRLGIPVVIGPHSTANLPRKADLVVYSHDIPQDNPELVEARRRAVLTLPFPEAFPMLFSGKTLI